jgi:hypothetical protein
MTTTAGVFATLFFAGISLTIAWCRNYRNNP